MKEKIINAKRLFYFSEVFKRGSINAVADQLDMSQAGIGRQIQLLEQELGMLLFERGTNGRGMVPGGHGRGMVPTEAAQILHEFYLQHRDWIENLEIALEEWRSKKRGNIIIAMPAAYVEVFMESLFQDFCCKHKNLNIVIEEVNAASQIEHRVREDAVHIGLTFLNHKSGADIRYHQRMTLPIQMMVSKAHPLANKRRVTFSEAACYPLALPPDSFDLRQMIQAVEQSEKVYLTPSLITGSISAQKKFCSKYGGAAFMSALAARREIEAGQLVALEVNHPIFNATEVGLIVRAHRLFSPAANQLLGLFAKRFSIFSQNLSKNCSERALGAGGQHAETGAYIRRQRAGHRKQ